MCKTFEIYECLIQKESHEKKLYRILVKNTETNLERWYNKPNENKIFETVFYFDILKEIDELKENSYKSDRNNWKPVKEFTITSI